MENASKALIIAGSVLIALMIISALLLMFNNLSSYQETNVQSTREAQVVEFNNQYETYNRNDVRGSDLYSLLNRAVDYNERKSSVGTEGASIAYQPITISFTIDTDQLSADGTHRLFTGRGNVTYTVSESTNTFKENVLGSIEDLERTYGADSLTNWDRNRTNIFLDGLNLSDSEKQEAISNFNKYSKNVTVNTWEQLKAGSQIREDVYKYHEYIQFKRAYFNCTNVEYNNQTGRIVRMDFEFTGNFN